MSAPRVSIIILNWNSWKDTIECLESVYRIDYPNYDVIVVDNASQDGSISKIKEYAQGKLETTSKFFTYNPENKPIKVFELTEEDALLGRLDKPLYEKYDPNRRMILIKNHNNYGYAGGNNRGIKFALSALNPDFILILNPDTVVESTFLKKLVNGTRINELVGIIGPAVYYYNYNGRSDIVDFAGAFIIPTLGRELRLGYQKSSNSLPESPLEVDKIEGSCMLVRKEVFYSIGLFDEAFFCYWEETDLCIRAKRRGFKLVVVPTARIWHKKGTSSGGSLSPFFVRYMARNKLLFIKKNYPERYRWHLLYIAIWELWFKAATFAIYYKKPKLIKDYVYGTIEGIRLLYKRLF